ncbi:MAG: hypothetical protein KDC27_07185 [Acidobacteria bacterium]|nr:hypothetical protein [Acidobacteriota bacterium]
MRNFLAIALACAMAAMPLPAASALGGVTTSGAVWTNQTALPSGSSVYAGDQIRTAPDAFAVLDSPATGRVELRGDTEAKVNDNAVALERGVVASAKMAVATDGLEISAADPQADNWFVVENQNGRRLIAAYRGDVVVRGRSSGSFIVPAGQYAMAAAAAPPAPRKSPDQATEADQADKKDDKNKKRAGGAAAGAATKSGWALGSLGHAASVAVVTGATAAALGGAVAAGAFRDDSTSPQN